MPDIPAKPTGRRYRLGLRQRLMLLACVVLAPMVGLQLVSALGARNDLLDAAARRAVGLARLAGEQEDDILRSASSLLQVLALVPAVQQLTPGACHALVDRLAGEHAQTEGLFVTGPSGVVKCTSLTADPHGPDLSDRDWFQQASAPGAPDIVIGPMITSLLTGRPGLIIASPIRAADPAGPAAGVVSAVLNLNWFTSMAHRVPNIYGTQVLILDLQDGTLVAATESGPVVGQKFPGHPLMKSVARAGLKAFQAPGLDGVMRVYAATPLHAAPGGRTVVLVGLPLGQMLGDANERLMLTLGLAFGLAAAAIIGAWWLARTSVLRPINDLVAAAEQLRSGDLTARVPAMSGAAPEFEGLAATLNAAATELDRNASYLRELANIDGLTGIANRREFDRMLSVEWRQARRNQIPLAVAMIDVDRFKLYNDRYGHVVGDDCLRSVATAIEAALRRPGDFVARYGGEEIAVIMPATDLEGAKLMAERLRLAVRGLALPHEANEGGLVTVSIGISSVTPGPEGNPVDALLRTADAALYRAKQFGRDRSAALAGD